jgi:uncharacterized coiled-coil protein SlyX
MAQESSADDGMPGTRLEDLHANLDKGAKLIAEQRVRIAEIEHAGYSAKQARAVLQRLIETLERLYLDHYECAVKEASPPHSARASYRVMADIRANLLECGGSASEARIKTAIHDAVRQEYGDFS